MPSSENIEDRRGKRRGGGGRRTWHRRDHRPFRHRLFHRHLAAGADRRARDGRRRRSRARRRRQPRRGRSQRPDARISSPRSSARPRRSGRKCCRRRPASPYEPATLVLYERRDPVWMRRRAVGDGAVLLPDRQEGLSRHVVLPRHEDQVRRRRRFRLCLCDRPRGRPSRAEPARHSRQGRRSQSSTRAAPRPTRYRCGSN